MFFALDSCESMPQSCPPFYLGLSGIIGPSLLVGLWWASTGPTCRWQAWMHDYRYWPLNQPLQHPTHWHDGPTTSERADPLPTEGGLPQMTVPFRSNGWNNHIKAPLVSVQRGRGIPRQTTGTHMAFAYTHSLAWAPQQNTKAGSIRALHVYTDFQRKIPPPQKTKIIPEIKFAVETSRRRQRPARPSSPATA